MLRCSTGAEKLGKGKEHGRTDTGHRTARSFFAFGNTLSLFVRVAVDWHVCAQKQLVYNRCDSPWRRTRECYHSRASTRGRDGFKMQFNFIICAALGCILEYVILQNGERRQMLDGETKSGGRF